MGLFDSKNFSNIFGSATTTAPATAPATTAPATTAGGGRRKSRNSRRTGRKSRRGGSALGVAALPFGILGLQRFFKTRKSGTDKKKYRSRRRRSSRRV